MTPIASTSMRANAPNSMGRHIRVSGLLLIVGLLVEAICLFRAHPLSFLIFITVGGAFLVLGLAEYLLSLLPATNPTEHDLSKQL